MHGVAAFVGHGVQVPQYVLLVVQQDVGIAYKAPGRKGPRIFALVFVAVTPAT